MEEDSLEEAAKRLQETLLKGLEGGVKIHATIGFYKSLLTHPDFKKIIDENHIKGFSVNKEEPS